MQVNDFNGGVLPNGLFWTVEIPRSFFKVHRRGRWAVLNARGIPLIDTINFGGLLPFPGQVDVHVVWQATGPRVRRGFGTDVAPDDWGAFIGHFAEARSVGHASGSETGFSFKTGRLTADDFFAEMGPQRNGTAL